MKQKRFMIIGLLWVVFLAACSAERTGQPPVVSGEREASEGAVSFPPPALETAVDEQGAVTVAVTPLDISGKTPSLDFEVTMDTHSVDLSMDLATLAILTTDNGRSVTATFWDAVPGGHHVSGVLSFPAKIEGTAVLEGASQLTLTIRNVDAPERVFTWALH
ncbi:MAG TPA: hypothetical protein PLD25_27060 [Chloroflexota bacterium]|nr:hypothetical protein [Chloroflexota bacterium]HUM67455.1 hypothetical protein [Chloroflexota bacterium]